MRIRLCVLLLMFSGIGAGIFCVGRTLARADEKPDEVGAPVSELKLTLVKEVSGALTKGSKPLWKVPNLRGVAVSEFVDSGLFKELQSHGVAVLFCCQGNDEKIPRDRFRIIRSTLYCQAGDVLVLDTQSTDPHPN